MRAYAAKGAWLAVGALRRWTVIGRRDCMVGREYSRIVARVKRDSFCR